MAIKSEQDMIKPDGTTFTPDHVLKILPQYFEAAFKGDKMFELRRDDRGFKVGDYILLKEWDGQQFTGRMMAKQITYILRDAKQYGLEDGYCILSLTW